MKMERSAYEKDLKKRQKQHLKNVRNFQRQNECWKPCLHDSCPECVGTGVKLDGSSCVHMLYCTCPRCSIYYATHVGDITTSGIDLSFSITSDPNFVITDGTIGYFTNTSANSRTVQKINA